ncbi:MAG: GtrA family protein [Rickettsiales bacterium]|nr:GtrA family protein [Rickettsiales bacterium]
MIHFLKIKNWIAQQNLSKQVLLFLLVGTGSTVISYSTFLVALRLFDVHYLLANICGFIPSIIFNYYCNRRWTFGFQGSNHFTAYLSLYLFSLALTSLLLRIFVGSFGIIPEIANIITIILVTFVNFVGVKFLVFKK